MKSLYKYISIVLISLLLISCSTEIALKTEFVPQTFIYGNLTNEASYLVITIQESVPVENTSNLPKPVSNASVALYTKNSSGTTSLVTGSFIEDNENYISVPLIAPIIGNSYWIEVTLQDGTVFKSVEEKLKNVIPIDTVTKVDGFTRVHFNDPVEDRNFYKLDVASSGNGISSWIYELSNDILFNGNENAFIEVESLLGNEIEATLLNFNYETYQFYLNIVAQEDAQSDGEEDEGGDPSQLFASPPVHLTGNILNTTTNRKALGNFGVVSVSRRHENIASIFPEEINNLIYYTGNKLSNTVIINTQGGPEPKLATQEFNEILSSVNTISLLKVNVHQAQTLNPQLFTNSEITFQQATSYDAESIEKLYKVIKYFKDQGKTVYVLGISFGAFMVQELIAEKGIDLADNYLIMVGRLDMNDTYWQGFSLGQDGHFENGITPVLVDQTEIVKKNMSKLAAGLGQNRYTQKLNQYPDLSKITYIYGKVDEAVGKLTQAEIDFLTSKNAKVIEGPRNHSQTIDDYIVEGFKEAFNIE
ncbi:MAG: hypothetical protein V3U92_02525 [Cellulophaga sp.]